MRTALLLLAAVLAAAAACDTPRTGDAAPPSQLPLSDGSGPTFASVAPILVNNCATGGCHTGNPPAGAPHSFDLELAYDAVVGRTADQASMPLVDPGNPANSYLLLKVKGQAGSAGGVPTQMPLNAMPLSSDDVAALEAWILAGAFHE